MFLKKIAEVRTPVQSPWAERAPLLREIKEADVAKRDVIKVEVAPEIEPGLNQSGQVAPYPTSGCDRRGKPS